MKYLFTAIIFFFTATSFAQPLKLILEVPAIANSTDTVYYKPSNKLAWDDFKLKPVTQGPEAALTSAGFGFGAGMHFKNGSGTLKLNVYCFFDRDKSWVKEGRKTDYILNHEQHHFDISYIGMLDFIQRLKKTSFTLSNYSNMLNQVYQESYDYMYGLQEAYDTETKNGQLKDKQAAWIAKIDTLLASYPKVQ